MKILCCVVTYNRADYTEKTLTSLGLTAGAHDFRVIVVDNGSTDGAEQFANIRNPRNLFPGAAVNIGWHAGLQGFDADLLMRSDNDVEYLPGWRQEVEAAFARIPELGMLGVLNRHEDYDGNQPVDERDGVNTHWDQVGGNCVIRREIYDQGFRWQPGAWAPGGTDEDSVAAAEIRKDWLVATVIPTVANNMSFHRYQDYPSYYNETASLRGLVPQLSV